MALAKQTFSNQKDGPIYISIEPNPECYELEPGDSLTLIYALPADGDAFEVQFVNERELVILPADTTGEPEVLVNGASAKGLSWKFKHFPA